MKGTNNGNWPFRFLASWFTHESFDELVKKNWKYSRDLNSHLTTFTGAVKEWNKNLFGNITL